MKNAIQTLDYSNISVFHMLHKDSRATIEISHINRTASKGEKNFYHIRRQYGTLMRQGHYDEMVHKYNNTDIYFSLNTFKFCSRKQENLFELKALYTDLDYYKLGLSQDKVLAHLKKIIKNKQVPDPTFIVDSGRGLYLIWQIQSTPRQAHQRWYRIMQIIHQYFKDVGADPSCIDSARIFRLTGSLHGGAKKTVQVIGGSLVTYNLNSLYKNYFSTPSLEELNKTKPKAQKPLRKKYLYYNRNNVLYLHNQYKSYFKRLQDLEKLAELREYNLKEYACRELMLFLTRYWHECYYRDREAALKKAIELNYKMKDPLSDNEVIRTSTPNAEAVKNHTYCYSNNRLIELLKITEDEQYQLQTIHSKAVKQKKWNDKRKVDRRNKKGLTSKQAELQVELEAVRELYEKRMSGKQIADTLGIDERKVRRLISKLKALE